MTVAPMGKHAIVIGSGIGGFAAAAVVVKLLSCDRVRSGRVDHAPDRRAYASFRSGEADQNLSQRAGALFRMIGKILVLTAIDDELDKARAPEGVEVIYSGVGKVNAASAATLALLELRPSLIINYGTAGKISKKLRSFMGYLLSVFSHMRSRCPPESRSRCLLCCRMRLQRYSI